MPPATQLLGALAPVIEALSPILDVAAKAIGLVADAIAGLIGWLTKGIEKVGEFAQGLKDTAVGKFIGGIGEGINNAAGNVRNFFAGNAKGTDNFEGGWTRVHEAGDEMIQAKHSGGLAYLPRGSAVIPASKTDELLDSDRAAGNVINITNLLPSRNNEKADITTSAFSQAPARDLPPLPLHGIVPDRQPTAATAPGWTPTVIEGYPLLDKATTPEDDGDHKDPPPEPVGTGGGGDSSPPSYPEPDPAPTPAADAEHIPTTRKIVELCITVSSTDQTLSPEMLEQIKEAIKPVVEDIFEEKTDENWDDLAVQQGYVAG